MSSDTLDTILGRMREKTTDELAEIWNAQDREIWTDAAFRAAEIVLRERQQDLSQLREKYLRDQLVSPHALSRPPIVLNRLERSLPLGLVSTLLSMAFWIIVIANISLLLILKDLPGSIEGYAYGTLGFFILTMLSYVASGLRDRSKRLREARKGMQVSDAQISEAPVLLLRSFGEDSLSPKEEHWLRHKLGFHPPHFQELLFDELQQFGPVVAVGLPGESLPDPGPYHIQLPEEGWKDKIDSLMGKARLIVVLLGPTSGLRWEISDIVEKKRLSKTLFVVPHGGMLDKAAWASLAPVMDLSSLLNLQRSAAKPRHPILLHFDRQGHGWVALSKDWMASSYRHALQMMVPLIHQLPILHASLHADVSVTEVGAEGNPFEMHPEPQT